jgi:uncharacterized membrane protein
MPNTDSSRPPTQTVARTIEEMVELEQREKIRMSVSDKLANLVTGFAGSMTFVWLNVVWFAVWIGLNLTIVKFDPFPFGLLTMIVSLEAIGLAIFVLISENRQAEVADKRAKLDLQVNLIAEQEITKLIEMVARIEDHLGLAAGDPELKHMQRPTRVGEIVELMEAYEESVDKDASEGPISAADTNA